MNNTIADFISTCNVTSARLDAMHSSYRMIVMVIGVKVPVNGQWLIRPEVFGVPKVARMSALLLFDSSEIWCRCVHCFTLTYFEEAAFASAAPLLRQ